MRCLLAHCQEQYPSHSYKYFFSSPCRIGMNPTRKHVNAKSQWNNIFWWVGQGHSNILRLSSVSFGRWVEKSRCSELGAVTWRWERNLERWRYWNALLSSSLKRNYVIYSLAKEFWMKSQERQSRAGSVGYVEDSELWKPLSVNSASPFPLCYPWPSALTGIF